MKLLMAAIMMLGLSGSAHARSIPEVRAFMVDELKRLAAALANEGESAVEHERSRNDSSYRLNTIRIRLRASAGYYFVIARLSFEPQMEIYFRAK